jgi:hypothetical protein
VGEPHFSNSYASKASVGGEKRQGERVSQGFPQKTHKAACGSSLAPTGKRVGDKGDRLIRAFVLKVTTLREIYRFKRAVTRCDARSKNVALFSIENAEHVQNSFLSV